MKITTFRPLQFVFSAVALLAFSLAESSAVDSDCDAVASKVKSAVSADPTKVLVVVEDALTANRGCTCEIVKAAIKAADADKELVKQIVITAVNTAEAEAATIAECAVAVAPEAARQIKEGLEEALGESTAPAGKAAPYVGGPVSVGGVYLIPPVGPSASTTEERVRVVVEQLPAASRIPETTPPSASPTN